MVTIPLSNQWQVNTNLIFLFIQQFPVPASQRFQNHSTHISRPRRNTVSSPLDYKISLLLLLLLN